MRKVAQMLVALAAFGAVTGATTLVANADGGRSYSWSGFYLGLHAGGTWMDVDWTSNCPGCTPVNQAINGDIKGFIGGAHVGAQHQFGNVVVGVEVSYSDGIDWSDRKTFFQDDFNRNFDTDIGGIFLATGRLGYAMDRTLLYVKGGYASADVELSKFRATDGALQSKSSKREDGWTVGGGIEHAFLPDVILGLEYNFIQLSGTDRNSVNTGGFVLQNDRNVDADIHSIMARLSFKIGRDETRGPLK